MHGGMTAMAETANQSGEARERRRAVQKTLTIGVIAAMGLVAGFYVGAHDARSGSGLFGGTWPPAAALLIAASYLGSLLIGGLVLSRRTDEVERLAQYKATAAAAASYIVLYPTWFVLWKGGFVPEPVHWVPFVIFWLVLAVSSLVYRYR